MKTGQCLCGSVQYRSEGPWRDVISCHCHTCRRTSGHFWAATAVPADLLDIHKDTGLVWFASSPVARRGFCNRCGSSLFYQHKDKSYIAVAAGTLDHPSDLKLVEEVFTHEKGDYYDLSPGVPHAAEWSGHWKAADENEVAP
jgi:hypothetical protein